MERITLSINTILINRQVKEANRGLPSLPMGATAFLYIHNQSQVGIILSFWTKYTGSTLLLSPVENYSCQETFVSRSPYAYKTLPVACSAGSPSVKYGTNPLKGNQRFTPQLGEANTPQSMDAAEGCSLYDGFMSGIPAWTNRMTER